MNHGPADYLLRFDSEAQAQQFGLANGFARANKQGNIVATVATHDYGLFVIGPHIQPPLDEESEPISDGKWWVLFRDLVGLDLPVGSDAFIVWASWQTEEVPNPDDPTETVTIPRPRPLDAPQVSWA